MMILLIDEQLPHSHFIQVLILAPLANLNIGRLPINILL